MRLVAHSLLDVLHQHQRLSNTIGVIAGLVGALSVLFAQVASHFAPHGWHRVTVALHMEQQPLIMKLEPVIGGIAFVLAIAAALIRFASWCLEPDHGPAATDDHAGTSK